MKFKLLRGNFLNCRKPEKKREAFFCDFFFSKETNRSVILLRDYEGYSYNEIAEITGLNEAQVKVYIYRGRLFLKKYIGSIETVI